MHLLCLEHILVYKSTKVMPSINRLAVRLFRKKPVQASIQTSLAASGAVPDSGFVFVHNLQGASAALDEFSGAVSAALEYIDLKGRLAAEGSFNWN